MRTHTNIFIGLDLDHRTQSRGIYRLVGQGHKGWSRHVDRELGNYDYLLGADVCIPSCLHVLRHLNVSIRPRLITDIPPWNKICLNGDPGFLK